MITTAQANHTGNTSSATNPSPDSVDLAMALDLVGDKKNTTATKRRKPNLQLEIPRGQNTSSSSKEGGVDTTNPAAAVSGMSATPIEMHKAIHNSIPVATQPPPVLHHSNSIISGGPGTHPLPHHGHGGISRTPSINLLRTASAESSVSTNGMHTPIGTSFTPLNTPSANGTTTAAAAAAAPTAFLIPSFAQMSLVSPSIPLSPHVSGFNHNLTRMSSTDSTQTVKIIDGELTRSDSLTSFGPPPPSAMRPQSGTPGFGTSNNHTHFGDGSAAATRGWTAVETPRFSSGHYVPFPPLISPTPRAPSRSHGPPSYFPYGATTNTTTHGGAPSPHLNYHQHRPQAAMPAPPSSASPSTASYPVFHGWTQFQMGGGVQRPHFQPRPPQQQVHRGRHTHHHAYGGGASLKPQSLNGQDGSGMSSSVSVGSNSTAGGTGGGGGGRSDEFFDMKMKAKNAVGSMPVCRHWVKGTCWYGSTCKFRHPDDE